MSDVSDMSDRLRGRNARRSDQNRSGDDRADLTNHLKLHFHFQTAGPCGGPTEPTHLVISAALQGVGIAYLYEEYVARIIADGRLSVSWTNRCCR